MESIIYEMSETSKLDENKKMPLIPKRSHYKIILFIIFTSVVLLTALPLFEQTNIHVKIEQNHIVDVWVETTSVSFISTVISSSEGIGINTIEITIFETGELFQLARVPAGEYVQVWVSNGVPQAGTYSINVQLVQSGTVVDNFDLSVTF